MTIKADFEMSPGSIVEFVRVLIPEAREKEMEVRTLSEGEEISIEVVCDGRKDIFTYPNHMERIDDQKIIMIKMALLNIYGKSYPWGGLIGVRPTKLVRRMLALKYTYDEIEEILMGLYMVTPVKARLLSDVVKKEMKYLNRDHINMYIGIPFCPTKCRYCSFASYEIGGPVGKFYRGVVDTLLDEIELTGEFLRGTTHTIESLYFGGGTPSVLTEEDLVRVLEAVKKHIDFTNIKEFTFEAGRVDTLNRRKLEIMKEYGVDRISLNPQTFNEHILKELNRSFDRAKFDEMYGIARELGFIINMDLILGLPGEGPKEIYHTLNEIEKYDMENLTIHVLALKRASKLYQEGYEKEELNKEEFELKLKELLEKKNLEPYYMYRQKNSIEWGENLGYAVPGTESIFNIEMIEENQSTMGMGGGAITKRIVAETEVIDRIDKVINPKDPALYIREMKERLEKKFELFKN